MKMMRMIIKGNTRRKFNAELEMNFKSYIFYNQ